ncbi:MAG: HlyD family secretion protein [Gammaproteobacteria bacterium]
MKSLKDDKPKFKAVQDVRSEQLRFGKYLYLTLITIFFLILIYVLFGHLFLLNGQGFVYSENALVELEFDSTVHSVPVKDGDFVRRGQLLFTFTSLELQKTLNEFSVKMHDIRNLIHKNTVSIAQLNQSIVEATKYEDYASKLAEKMKTLRERGLVDEIQISPEAERSSDAKQDLIQSQTLLKHEKLNSQQLQNQLKDMQERYDDLLRYFNAGRVLSTVDGVVTKLSITLGDVLEKGTPAMRIYYGERYIYGYFNQTSWVNYKLNDRVIISIPGEGYKLGTIIKLLPITDKLPDEFQPRFKEKLRRQLVVVKLDDDLLKEVPIMSTVTIYKPIGFGIISKFL